MYKNNTYLSERVVKELPGLANECTRHPVKCEFRINNKYFLA